MKIFHHEQISHENIQWWIFSKLRYINFVIYTTTQLDVQMLYKIFIVEELLTFSYAKYKIANICWH